MNVFETIADRRIREARENGLFDNLPGAGKPIPDLGVERKPGWWAERIVKAERSQARAEQLDRELRAARPGLWRLGEETSVRAEVAAWNERIDEHNRAATVEHRARFDVEEVVDLWRDTRRARRLNES